MFVKNGIYTFNASKGALVDRVALVKAMNNHVQDKHTWCWRLKKSRVSWFDKTARFMKETTSTGSLYEFYEVSEVSSQQKDKIDTVRKFSEYLKDGWIEIRSCINLETTLRRFHKLRIHANGQVEEFFSEQGFNDGDAQYYCMHEPQESNPVEVAE